MWDRVVSCGTDQTDMGLTSLIFSEKSNQGQSNLIWDKAVSFGTEQSYMEKCSLICRRAVQDNFSEVLECLASFKIFFYDF